MVRYASMILSFGLVLGLVGFAAAEDAKEVTLKGTITCAKCGLKLDGQKTCATVIVVKGKDNKEVVYWFDADAHKKNHGDTCQEAKEGTVTGTPGKDGDKMTIKVTKLEYTK